MTTPPEIAHTIQLLEAYANTTARSTSDAIDWMNDARIAMEAAADLITALIQERDHYQNRTHTAETILDRIYPHLTTSMHHLEGCDADDHPYPQVIWAAGGCKACETLSLIRYWFDQNEPYLNDREIEAVIPNSKYL